MQADDPHSGLKPGDHAFLVDGSSFIFRAYFQSINQDRKYNFRSDRLPTGAVRLFCTKLFQFLRVGALGIRPTHLAIIFDKSEESFRKAIYPAYKANRQAPPEELVPQFPLMREAVRAFGLTPIEREGYEADDLIAAYAKQAVAAGADALIVSADKDMMQLIRPGISMYDPASGEAGGRGSRPERIIGPDEVMEQFGTTPDKVIDVQALIGDSTDNVPGVPGIGPKAASLLISEFGSLDALLAWPGGADGLERELNKKLRALTAELNDLAGEPVKLNSAPQIEKILRSKYRVTKEKIDAETIEILSKSGAKEARFCELLLRGRSMSRVAGAAVRKIVENADLARLSRRLVTLDDDAPLDVPLADLAVTDLDGPRLIAFLKAMEFTSLTRRVAEATGAEVADVEPDPALKAEAGVSQSVDPEELAPQGQAVAGSPQALAEARAVDPKLKAFDRAAYEAITSLDRLEVWIAEAQAAGRVAFDTETDGLDAMQARLVGFSLATAPGRACYVPLRHRPAEGLDFSHGEGLNQLPVEEALARLKPLLEDPSVLKIGQNVKFDWQILRREGIAVAPFDDTMLMSYALDAGRGGHGMDELSERWLGHKPIAFADVAGTGKKRVTFDLVPIDAATRYAAEDADVTLRLWLLLKPRLAAEGATTVYETLERPLVSVLAKVEARGVRIDRVTLSRLSGEFAEAALKLEGRIHELAGETFSVGSPKQLGDILFGKMKLPGATKTKMGAWGTKANLLEELAEAGHALPRLVLDWRQLAKLKSTYTDALVASVNPETQRIHTSFALAATSTGRLSSSDPNLQNIPIRTEEGRKIRRAFIAAQGMKLLSADYSQIELRLLAHMADIPELKKAFSEGIDIHSMTASELFGVPVKGIDPTIRRRAKTINFGIIYGISAFGLANQLGIPREEARDYIKRYFDRFPGIRAFMEATKEQCRATGFVMTLFGRRCHYPDIRASNPSIRAFNERAAINAPIQGTGADIIRRAMIRMDGALEEAGLSARMLLQVHDELVFEVREEEGDQVAELVRRVMEEAPAPVLNLSVPLAVDARRADNWEEAH